MKKNLILARIVGLLACVTFSCANKEEPNLTTNQIISESSASNYLEKTLPKSNVLINNIEYVKKGGITISYITYNIDGKTLSNLAFINGRGNVILKGKPYSVSESGGYVVKCTGNCSGSSAQCIMRGTYDPNTNTNTIECSCEGCVMQVNQQ